MTGKFPAIGILAKPVRHQVAATGCIERSLKAAGYDRVRATYDFTAPEPIVFCWGWGKAKEVRAVNPGAVICCLDHGYTLDRKQHINTGWLIPSMRFGLNGFAEHPWVDDAGIRLKHKGWDRELGTQERRLYLDDFGRAMSDRPGPRRALVLGQVYGDAMIVDHVEDYGRLRDLVQRLTEEGWDTVFRPHPIMVARGTADKYGNLGRRSPGGSLADDLARCDMVAAMNSNGLVQGYMAGLETRAWNRGTMLSPLMTEPGVPISFNHRDQWAARLAYAQWSYEELDNGTWAEYNLPIMRRLAQGGPAYPWCDRRIDG